MQKGVFSPWKWCLRVCIHPVCERIKPFFLCLGRLFSVFQLHLVENGQQVQMYRKRFPLDKSHPGARTHILHLVKQCFFFIGCLKDKQDRAEKKIER